MRNNKGFSLVELIIVIAIMAILVGVMAPQLIKYIEKTNVSSDTQLCDSVKTAITTAMMDPAVINTPSNDIPTSQNTWLEVDGIATGTGKPFGNAVAEILGISLANIDSEIKSAHSGGVQYMIVNSNSVHVQIAGSDNTGNKNTASGNNIYVD